MINKCTICGGSQKSFLKGKDYLYQTNVGKTFEIVKCENCGLEQIYPIPTDKEIASFYANNYYSYKKSDKGYKTLSEKILGLFHTMFGLTDFYLEKYYEKGKENKKFLEIGGGTDKNLKIMSKKGREAEGFEIGEKNKKGDMFYGESIVSTDFGKKYDLIYMSHSFEHIPNPIESLNKIKELLNDEGICIIVLPNVGGLSCQTFKGYAVERDIPRHLFNYDYKNLEKLLKNIGFTIIKKRKMESIGSSESLNKLLKDKYGIEFLKSKAFIPLRILLIIGDILCTLCNQGSQMGFIIKKS